MQRIVSSEVEDRSTRPCRRRRGLRGQRRRRRREREVKQAAVAYVRCFRQRGHGSDEAARHLQLCPRTLRRWEQVWHGDRLALQVRGRPVEPAEAELRAAVYAALQELGPGIGVLTLRRLFPEAGKRELE